MQDLRCNPAERQQRWVVAKLYRRFAALFASKTILVQTRVCQVARSGGSLRQWRAISTTSSRPLSGY